MKFGDEATMEKEAEEEKEVSHWVKLGLTAIIAGCACYATSVTGESQFGEAAWVAAFVWVLL